MAISIKRSFVANVFIYKTVKNLFLNYSAPYISYSIRRNVNPRIRTVQRHKQQMISNVFAKNSLIFSHLNISYAPSLLLAIFLLDGKAELRRIKEKQRERAFYYLSGTFAYEMRHTYSYFRKNMYIFDRANHTRKASIWRRYNLFYRKGLGFIAGKPKRTIITLFNKVKKLYPKFFRNKKLDKMPLLLYHQPYKHLPAWIINAYQFFPRKLYGRLPIKNLRILCFLLRYLKCYHNQSSKKRLFYLNLLFNSISSCLLLICFNRNTLKYKKKYKTVYHKLIYLQSTLFLQLTRHKFIYLKYNKKLFHSRLLLFNLYAKILLFTIRKTAFISSDRQLIIRFLALNNRNYSAQFLVNYISLQLSQYYRLNSIIKPIIRRLLRTRLVAGFRFIISGRITRKERASYIVHSHKSMPLASSSITIDYANDFRIMRFGVVGIKVYLRLSKNIPYYYFFEFRNKL
jgi:hypothetical protein